MTSNGSNGKGRRLYVGNIPYTMDEARLAQVFTDFGFPVSNARVVLDRETGRSKGFGFVDADAPEKVGEMIQQIDGARIDGRILRVAEANERPPKSGGAGGGVGGGGGFARR
jgi:cold-inducible RNA-binding protein